MKPKQNQDGQDSASSQGARADAELSDEALDTITGGHDSAIPMQTGSNAASTDIQPQPINVVLGRVVNRNFA